MKKIVAVLVLLVGIYVSYQQEPVVEVNDTVAVRPNATTPSNDSNWRSGSQVSGSGTVGRVLSDDNDGSRHQRFILRLSSGRSVLVAHNIDLAPRIHSIAEGDTVSFYGQFETNDRGGVIHWTHKDPQGRHAHGWLEHNGRRYQ